MGTGVAIGLTGSARTPGLAGSSNTTGLGGSVRAGARAGSTGAATAAVDAGGTPRLLAGWFKPRRSSSVRRPERRGGGGAATSSKAPSSARLGNGARLGAGGLPSPGGTSSTSGVGFVDIGLGGDQGLAAPAEGARGGDAALPVDGPPGGAGSAPAGVLRAGRPEKIGGFQLVAMFNGPGQEIRIHRSARAGSKHASRGQPSTLASVSKATSSIHNTTERHTRPTMLCRCPA